MSVALVPLALVMWIVNLSVSRPADAFARDGKAAGVGGLVPAAGRSGRARGAGGGGRAAPDGKPPHLVLGVVPVAVVVCVLLVWRTHLLLLGVAAVVVVVAVTRVLGIAP